MQSNQSKIATDALSIWQAGVDAVNARKACERSIAWENPYLYLDDEEYLLDPNARIIVVGAGKAAIEMATGVNEAFKSFGLDSRVDGWINVPGLEDTVLPKLTGIKLWPCRPLGSNLPTERAVSGTQQILKLVRQAQPKDIVICLLSGGGSSLLVDPIPEITLDQKIDLTQTLARAGADIHQLNTVRRTISNVKGGGLLRACAAEQMATLVISDVLDDDLSTIASGPTYDRATADPEAAIEVVRQLLGPNHELVSSLENVLRSSSRKHRSTNNLAKVPANHTVSILANNATAVDAAGIKAVELGYRYLMHCHRRSEGDAFIVGQQMGQALQMMSRQSMVDCEIVGGEPTVDMQSLSSKKMSPGDGGRNQHVALSAALELANSPEQLNGHEFCLLSGGTDGEDGNTPHAGAWVDHETLRWIADHRSDVENALSRFDSNSIFARTGTLIDSGLTGTNVCDLRIALFKG